VITDKEREAALALLARSRTVVLNAVDGVTDYQARWKPAPERWSILEYVEHLAVSEDALIAMVKRSLEEPAHVDSILWVRRCRRFWRRGSGRSSMRGPLRMICGAISRRTPCWGLWTGFSGYARMPGMRRVMRVMWWRFGGWRSFQPQTFSVGSCFEVCYRMLRMAARWVAKRIFRQPTVLLFAEASQGLRRWAGLLLRG